MISVRHPNFITVMRGFLSGLVTLRWKLAAVVALSPRTPPADFPKAGPRLIVALAADYGNLGDVALTRALVQLAAVHFPSHRPYLLCAGRVFRDLKGVAAAASPDDVVALVGGGNMGDLYPDLEEARLRVVRAFPRQRIVSFPQSIEFSNTSAGRRSLARSRQAYATHPMLTIFARDAESERTMRQAFPETRILAAPDTVLSMTAPSDTARTVPLIVCLRHDKEAGLTEAHRESLLTALANRYPRAVITDTLVTGPRLSYEFYNQHLEAFLAQIASARCVVTDRLHGLIFAVITGTPCVVIENNNHKIRSLVATWLGGVSSVRLLNQPDDTAVFAAVESVMASPSPRPDLAPAFAPLVKALKG